MHRDGHGAHSVQQKRGRRPPPFLAGEVAYRFLPPFFFPPLAVFFAITLIPPFARRLVVCEELSPHYGAATAWPPTRVAGAHRLFA